MKEVIAFLKKETVLTAAWVLAVCSMFLVKPDAGYLSYIDIRSLGILWSLMIIMQGLKNNYVFDYIGIKLLKRTKKVWQLTAVLVFLCFFSSMFITNDVALITFVPFALMMLQACGREELLIPVVVLQTIAANLGSMLTPIGNPQNLYLYGLSGMGVGDFVRRMLPYTAAAGALLVFSLLLLKGKKGAVVLSGGTLKEEHIEKAAPKIGMYAFLFLIALLVVGRVLHFGYLVFLVFCVVLFMEPKCLKEIDYYLLLTFVGFFIFTGNIGRIPAIHQLFAKLVSGQEIIGGVLLSQIISNVPAALLLSGFTEDYAALLLGVNLGGLGTLIASMASLISYKTLAHNYNGKKGRYLGCFTVANLLFLAVLLALAVILKDM